MCMAVEKADRIRKWLEWSRDSVLHLPHISLFGNLQCCVENHQGILKYTPELVGVEAGHYQIYIAGEELLITSLSAETISIEGRIGQVRYEF